MHKFQVYLLYPNVSSELRTNMFYFHYCMSIIGLTICEYRMFNLHFDQMNTRNV